MENAVILSHRKDADGISAASLLRSMTGGRVYLADYGEMVSTLSTIPSAKDVYISDLGLNRTMFESFQKELTRLCEGGTVHYIDHHPLNPEYGESLRSLGVDLFHSTEESAAVLVYKKFQKELENVSNAKLLACCGAITDYLDERAFARKLISSFDRQFLLYEATVLSFSIAMIGREGVEGIPQLVSIVTKLADEQKLPHQLGGAAELSQRFAAQSAELIQKVKAEGKRMRNFAYLRTSESATGNIANFLLGAFDVPVGAAFRAEEAGYLEVSARGSDDCTADLGKLIGKIATELGNSGGGHPKAAGARIRSDQFDDFVAMFDSELSKTLPATPERK